MTLIRTTPAPPQHVEPFMYVCSCNALTDTDMRRVIDQHGVDRPAAVFAACKCRAQCGNCVASVCALLGLNRRCGNKRDVATIDICPPGSPTLPMRVEAIHAA